MISRVILIIGLLAFANSQSATITNCNTSSIFVVSQLDIQPTIPVVGQNITMTISYDAPTTLLSGVARYECNYNGLPYVTTETLCSQTSCPIEIGSHVEKSNTDYSGLSGKVKCKIIWLADDLLDVYMCVQSIVSIPAKLRGYSYNFNMDLPIFQRIYTQPLPANYWVSKSLVIPYYP